MIGDGALTGGMAWEALNNIAAGQDRRLVIVVNDNGAPTRRPSAAWPTTSPRCAPPAATSAFLSWGKQTLRRTGDRRAVPYETLHGVKKGLKDIVAPQGMFEDLGLKYVGPVDGHDVAGDRARRCARRGPSAVR